jgi:hypothetical protein
MPTPDAEARSLRLIFLLLLACSCAFAYPKEYIAMVSANGSAGKYNLSLNYLDWAHYPTQNTLLGFNVFHIRTVEDGETWRITSSWLLGMIGMAGVISPGAIPAERLKPVFYGISKNDLEWMPILFFFNPTLGYRLVGPWWVAAGYNSDFFLADREIFFAPKLQTEIHFNFKNKSNLRLTLAASYQVFQCYSADPGWKLNLGIIYANIGRPLDRSKK